MDGHFFNNGPLRVVADGVDLGRDSGFSQGGADAIGKVLPCLVLLLGAFDEELDLDAELEDTGIGHGGRC